MRVALTLDFRNPMGRPWREHWDDCLWFLTEAERLGFDALYVQEHFFTTDGYAPSVPIFLTALAERTERARIGSWAYVLPLHNAAQLAQETAVLDHLSGGRLDVTVGSGHRAFEYKAFGRDPKSRPSRMEEGLAVLVGAWTNQPFSYRGRYHDLADVVVEPRPRQEPHPPLWVASTAPASARRAGRHGAHLAAASVDPAVFEAYRDGLAEAGVDIATRRVSIPMSVTVTDEDPEAVWARNEMRYFERYEFYRLIRAEMGDPDLQLGVAPAASAYRENELIGDAGTVLATIQAVATPLGVTDLVVTGPAAGIPLRTEAYDSLVRFAAEVLPALHRAP